MRRHRDDGYNGDSDPLRARAYTTVTYLNDNYKGGETYIKTERGDYISVPKKGTTIIMKSTPENVHGVTTITSGLRVTLPIWFTKDKTKIEEYIPRHSL
jgi:predicted 2-oxoglutarate/Fe(II)-dependent dioxygenase YbiX